MGPVPRRAKRPVRGGAATVPFSRSNFSHATPGNVILVTLRVRGPVDGVEGERAAAGILGDPESLGRRGAKHGSTRQGCQVRCREGLGRPWFTQSISAGLSDRERERGIERERERESGREM